jgi:hypothetical protein
MVRELFGVTPDPWQDEALACFPTTPQLALLACKGPGKTAVLAWLCWNFVLTRPAPCKIGVTAISGQNLKDNLWAELAIWQNRSPLLKELFQWTAERIFSKESDEVGREKWISAKNWPRDADSSQQANTWAGLHAPYVMAVLDESGGIPTGVMVAAQGIGSGAPLEWHIVQAGNPTHLEGPLYRAATIERDQWKLISITGDPDDPKRSPRVPIEWARQQIKAHGADNPYVLVNIFGRFPPSSLNALIGPDQVNEAIGRHLLEPQYVFSPRVLGVDVARFGDDRSVIFPRQGLASFTPIVLRNAEDEHGAGVVAQKWTEWKADACFIDATGGWASGWRVALRAMGRSPLEVQFAGKATDPKYFNKRAEIWFEMCQWIKDGGALPNVPEIVAELTTPLYTFKGDRLILEEKDQVKARLGRSPDLADALATTFAAPVHVNRNPFGQDKMGKCLTDYDPYDSSRN